jgi:hypothetical protein
VRGPEVRVEVGVCWVIGVSRGKGGGLDGGGRADVFVGC